MPDFLNYEKHYLEGWQSVIDEIRQAEWAEIGAGYLPEALDEPFGEIVKMPETPWHEVEFRQSKTGDLWQLSCHEISPFNPRGYDFFFRGDGTYLGFWES